MIITSTHGRTLPLHTFYIHVPRYITITPSRNLPDTFHFHFGIDHHSISATSSVLRVRIRVAPLGTQTAAVPRAKLARLSKTPALEILAAVQLETHVLGRLLHALQDKLPVPAIWAEDAVLLDMLVKTLAACIQVPLPCW